MDTDSPADNASYSRSLRNVLLYGGSIFVLLVVKVFLTAIYNVYFHPLKKYPGPKLAAATSIVYNYFLMVGTQVSWTRRLHEEYGEVVRLGPNRLSYINPQAWKDITGHRTGKRKENSKDAVFNGPDYSGEDSVLAIIDTEEHARTRKIFTNAFSEKALKLQEPLIKKYVAQLTHNLSKESNGPIDLVKMYNCTTFDIMAHLSFGEPLGMLDNSEYTPWVKAVFGRIKAGAFARIAREYPLLQRLVHLVIPQSLKDQEKLHFGNITDQLNRRLEKGDDPEYADFWSLVLKKGGDDLNFAKMHANASLFMIAGTETTATLLSGLTWFLLTNPDKMEMLVKEVRALSEDELSLEVLPRLPYLNACFEEGLRTYPPVPIGVPRVIPEGGNIICGDWLPADASQTRVFVSQEAAYYSPLNFKDPKSFIPERWLPNSGYETDNKSVLQPFAFGPRACLGRNLAYHEMRIILATVLWHFNLQLCEESASWRDQKSYALWDKPPLWVKVNPIR